MSDKEDIVGNFIQKVSEIQNSKDDEDVSTADLKQIALETGLSEDDWEKVQKVYGDHLKRGSGFLSHKNYSDAISEYKQALILSPDSEDTLFGLATAYRDQFIETGTAGDRELAEKFAARCLDYSPTHEGALSLISDLKKKVTASGKKGPLLFVSLGLVAGIILLILMAFFRSV